MFFRKNKSSGSNQTTTKSKSSTSTTNKSTTTNTATSTSTSTLNSPPFLATEMNLADSNMSTTTSERPSMDIFLAHRQQHNNQTVESSTQDQQSSHTETNVPRNRNSLRLSIGHFFKDKLNKIRHSLNRNSNLNFDDIEAAVALEQLGSPSSSTTHGYYTERCSMDTSRSNASRNHHQNPKQSERGRNRAISDGVHPKKRPVSVTLQQLQSGNYSGSGFISANPYSMSSSSSSGRSFPSPRQFLKSTLFSNKEQQESKDIKVLVLGATAVGKSALCSQYLKGIFPSQHVSTVEDQFKKVVDIDGETTSIHILDTWGDVLLQNESSLQSPQDVSNSTSSLQSSQSSTSNLVEHLSKPSKAITSIVENASAAEQNHPNSDSLNNCSFSNNSSSCSSSLVSTTILGSSMAESCTLTDASSNTSSKNMTSSSPRRNSCVQLERELKKSIMNQISSSSNGSFFASNVVILLMYSISDYSSFEKVLQIYENLQLLAVESHLKNYNEELANNSKKKGSLTKRSPRCKYYSFQPTILLVGTKRDQDPSIARSNLIHQLTNSSSFTVPTTSQQERRPSIVQQPPTNNNNNNSSDMYGFYYGFGLSNEDKTQFIHSLPARIPITKSNKRRPSIYSQYEYAMCGCTETERQVTFEEGEQLAATIGENCYFMEISNQNPLEVEQVFLQAVRKVRERMTQLSNSEFARAARAQPISYRTPLSECVSVSSSRASSAATPYDEDTWNALNATQQQQPVSSSGNHSQQPIITRKEVPRLLSPTSDSKEARDEKQRRRRKDIKVLENCAALTDELINYM
ncbi:hypothetical protein C9374_012854 [Naegleria lovaniensis]|uniref:Ras family small GTPase n=1 Tax=Naegleria lovaniensis TaxID=51637 RepID=A0AA88GCK0_NAELO|nr:uncharacterized protein C9374_012854 [Naegleria lovaniensis]KAG2373122.1 hypothetical protein C9374_012854 [Naegleria lovaniensis]